MAVLTGRPLAFGCLALVATLLLSFFLPSAVSLLFSLLFFFFFAAFLSFPSAPSKKDIVFYLLRSFFLDLRLDFSVAERRSGNRRNARFRSEK